ncbi:hypothetical protein LGN03_09000 [Burkholderia multivorans]|nr:hypothetical protein [Burkholderia multivorans]
MTEDQINRRWVEILLDTLSAEKPVTIGPRDASCFINALCALLAPTQQPSGEVTEQPSLTNPLTPYGMLCRALRIVTGTSLGDMAKSLQISCAKLSAMEFGREQVTPEIVREVGKYFEHLGVGNMRPAL